MNRKLIGLACGVFAAASAASGSAHAFVEGRYKTFAEGYGNNNVYGSVNVTTHQENVSGTVGVTTPTGFASRPYLSSYVGENFDTNVKIFGRSAKPLVGRLRSEARWQLGNNESDIHTPSTSGSLTVLGSVLYSSSGASCGTGARCLMASKLYEKEFARQSATFLLWGIPVTVTGIISGFVGVEMIADATAVKVNGEKWSLNGTANGMWGPVAGLLARFDTCVGICGVLAVGVTGNFGVLLVSAGPSAQSKQTTRLNGDAKYSWSNGADIDLTTMNGRASIWADYIFGRDEEEFVSWDGYSDEWQLWGHTGNTTCTGYRNRPYSDCYDVKN